MMSDMKPNFRERLAERQSVQCPVAYTDGIFCATGVVTDFTMFGVRVRGSQEVQADMKLVLFLLPPGRSTQLLIRKGTVRWIDGTSFGIDLEEVSPASQEELGRLAALYLPSLWASLN